MNVKLAWKDHISLLLFIFSYFLVTHNFLSHGYNSIPISIRRPFNFFLTRMFIELRDNRTCFPISHYDTGLGSHLVDPSMESIQPALVTDWMARY